MCFSLLRPLDALDNETVILLQSIFSPFLSFPKTSKIKTLIQNFYSYILIWWIWAKSYLHFKEISTKALKCPEPDDLDYYP